jgi:hypothetical protein
MGAYRQSGEARPTAGETGLRLETAEPRAVRAGVYQYATRSRWRVNKPGINAKNNLKITFQRINRRGHVTLTRTVAQHANTHRSHTRTNTEDRTTDLQS